MDLKNENRILNYDDIGSQTESFQCQSELIIDATKKIDYQMGPT